MIPKIFIAESSGFSTVAVDRLQAVGYVEQADAGRAELLSRAHDADVLWIRLRHQIDREVMNAAPRLRAIATATTGLNHIDVHEAERRGIQIISLRGETEFLRNVYATAEHTMAIIFGLIRHLPAACQHVNGGGWNRDLFIGRELRDKRAGIIGYGRVGRMLGQYLRAFGMRVCISDPAIAEPAEEGVEQVGQAELLETSDLVTLHVGLNDTTRRFFGKREFESMKKGSWFVNTSRGELVDEAALLRALRAGRIAGAALDVLCKERSAGMSRRPLVEYARLHNNLLITPHIGGCTIESREKTENFLASRIVAFLRNRGRRELGARPALLDTIPQTVV